MVQPFAEFAGNKHLLWIANEWFSFSEQLADWAMERLVNRRDVWSQYTIKAGKVGVVMLPIAERRKLGSDMVTLRKLRRHFAGKAVSHLIGLHSISDHSTCKWFAVDVDLHDEKVINADELARANFNACMTWAERLRGEGFDPFLLDSNGVGGFHLWTLLDREYPLADVYDYANELRHDYVDFGLQKKPEIFPPRREVTPDDLPYGLRLPGRHHWRPHYSRVWNFDRDGDNDWLEGGEAIEFLLGTRPAGLRVSQKKGSPSRAERSTPKKKSPKMAQHRARVCMDLDGVLAQYDGWKGLDKIGSPIEGALKFARSIAEFADIIVFTSRCSTDTRERDSPSGLTPGQLRIRVIEWLEQHKFPFTDVYVGQGKPAVDAFIDDRAVPCRPQSDSAAYKTALSQLRKVVRNRD
jgi:hypothetical protein